MILVFTAASAERKDLYIPRNHIVTFYQYQNGTIIVTTTEHLMVMETPEAIADAMDERVKRI